MQIPQMTITLDLTPENTQAMHILALTLGSMAVAPTPVPNIAPVAAPAPTAEMPENVTPITLVPEAKKPKAPEPEPEVEGEVKREADESGLTLADIRSAALRITGEGKQTGVNATIKSFGAKKLSEIDEADYPAFMIALGEL